MGRVENKATHKPEHILGKLCDISNAITHEHLYFCLGYVTRHWKPASISQSLLSSGELLGNVRDSLAEGRGNSALCWLIFQVSCQYR